MPVGDFAFAPSMDTVDPFLTRGESDKPVWAPPYFPSLESLNYTQKLFAVGFIFLGMLYFAGITPVRAFTKAHVADVGG